MNPALPPLLALTAAAAFVAWRARGARLRATAEAVAFHATLALALLAPHLAHSDGVPSGASLLRELPPWRGVVEAAPRTANPELGDLPFQVEPRQIFVREELRAGRIPFWNPYAFGGYPLWATAQAAPMHRARGDGTIGGGYRLSGAAAARLRRTAPAVSALAA